MIIIKRITKAFAIVKTKHPKINVLEIYDENTIKDVRPGEDEVVVPIDIVATGVHAGISEEA